MKNLPNIFISLNTTGPKRLYIFFILNIKKTWGRVNSNLFLRFFVEFFTADLLKKNQNFTICLCRNIYKNVQFFSKISTSKTCFAFFSKRDFDGVSPTSGPDGTRWSLIFFFVRKLVTGASLPRSPFFKMGLLLSYRHTLLGKRMLFLRGGESDRPLYSFFSLTRMNLKKRASR